MGYRSFTLHVVLHDGYECRHSSGIVSNAKDGPVKCAEILKDPEVKLVRVRDCLGGMWMEVTRDRTKVTP